MGLSPPPHVASLTVPPTLPARISQYPPAFMARHPLQTLRNLVGNHPSKLANHYLGGLCGVEIGGASYNNFFLETINVDYALRSATAGEQVLWAGRVMPVDVVARADALPFPDGAFDFVLASHVAEHLPDPIKCLREWARVARRYMYLILPQPTNVHNHGRPLTSLAELVDRHERGFDSWQDRYHWTVWAPETFCELCTYLGMPVVEVQDPDDKRGNGFAVVLNVDMVPPSRS
jgi:SAM-dependent methyltransferase